MQGCEVRCWIGRHCGDCLSTKYTFKVRENTVKKIFTGQITHWDEVDKKLTGKEFTGKIQVYARDNKSGTFDTFKAVKPDARFPDEYLKFTQNGLRLSLNFRFKKGTTKPDNKVMRDINRRVDFLAKKENKTQRLWAESP